MIRFFNIFFYTIFIAVMLGIAGLLLGSMLPIPGNIEIKIVKSGSMEPNIPTGSVVIVKPSYAYHTGDIITFGKDTQRDIPTTHRVIAVAGEGAGTTYTTKGDANEEQDGTQTPARDIIGKVVFALPYMGFVLDFARQPLGFALLIGVPAGLVILEELMTIFKEVGKSIQKRRRRNKDDEQHPHAGDFEEMSATLRRVYARRRAMDEIFVPMFVEPGIFHKEWWHKNLRMHKDTYGTSTALVLGLVFMSTLFAGASGGTIAYFSDIERSVGNIFRAGVWQETADPQDIVINEFLPNPDDSANGLNFGDDNDSKPLGEWVELYNNGNVPQDLTGWYIADESGGLGNQAAIISALNTVPATTTISAHGWLVVYLNHQTLNNPNGDSVYLYTNLDVLVDSYTYPDHDFCENEPTPASTNASSTPSGGGSCGPGDPAAPPNKSFARIPDGTGAFVDPIPTPGAPNIPDPLNDSQSESSDELASQALAEPMPTPLLVEEIVIPAANDGEVLGESDAPADEGVLPSEPPPADAGLDSALQDGQGGAGGGSGGTSGGGSAQPELVAPEGQTAPLDPAPPAVEPEPEPVAENTTEPTSDPGLAQTAPNEPEGGSETPSAEESPALQPEPEPEPEQPTAAQEMVNDSL